MKKARGSWRVHDVRVAGANARKANLDSQPHLLIMVRVGLGPQSFPFLLCILIYANISSLDGQSTPCRRRLIRDFKHLSSDPPAGISGAPCPENIMVWNAVIFGPADTPFEDGTFKLVLTFEESYPNKPPHVKFLSRMFHPNVYGTGELCLDILQNRWSPTYDVSAILTSIQSLLHDPNPNRYVIRPFPSFILVFWMN